MLANQIDGVLPRVRARLGAKLTYDSITEWRLPIGDSDIATEIAFALKDSEYVLGMPVHSGARELVDALYPKNLVVVLTARPASTKDWTSQWLANNGFTFDDLVNVKEERKSLFNSDVLIDDYIGNIKDYLTHARGTAILVSQPWNKRAPEELAEWTSSGRLHIVQSLEEAQDIVLKMKREVPSLVPIGPGGDAGPSNGPRSMEA